MRKPSIGYYICMCLGIIITVHVLDLDMYFLDTRIAAGLECAIGAACGIGAYYLIRLVFQEEENKRKND